MTPPTRGTPPERKPVQRPFPRAPRYASAGRRCVNRTWASLRRAVSLRRLNAIPIAIVTLLVASCEQPTEVIALGEPSTITLRNFDATGYPLVRFDVDGNPLDAHGGEIRLFGDTYYLYGETYACGFQWLRQEPVPFCGFRAYSSPNLVDWKDEGLLFDVSSWEPWQSRCHWWTAGCFRPHVVHNEKTGKYVLWVNSYANPVNYYVLEADSPIGPFVERGVPTLALNTDAAAGSTNNGDQNLFVDDDGTGYVIYTEWRIGRGDLVIERLTEDYLNGTGEYVRVGTRGSESPSLFKREGRYYVTASTPPNGGFATSATSYFTAGSPLGRWSGRKEISRTSCGGQPFHVSELPSAAGGKWYLYQSDLWLGPKGKAPGDPNQAPAALFWAPLFFRGDGSIAGIECRESYGVPALIHESPSGGAEHWRLMCDVGMIGPRGTRYREIRFRPTVAGKVSEILINAYQRYEPDGPLTIEIRRTGASSDPLATAVVHPKPEEWHIAPEIFWTARKHAVPVDLTLDPAEEYSIRLSADLSRGCYGLAIRDEPNGGVTESFLSEDGGGSWMAETGRRVRYELVFGTDVGGASAPSEDL